LARIYERTLLTGEEVTVPGVGKLKVVTKAARNGRNPKTGEAIQIPAKRVVEFTPSAEFKASVSPV
jgi:DNA-binding protein HU-beta